MHNLAATLLEELDNRLVTAGSLGIPIRLLEPSVYKYVLKTMIDLMEERIENT
jgi:hypothetical protein